MENKEKIESLRTEIDELEAKKAEKDRINDLLDKRNRLKFAKLYGTGRFLKKIGFYVLSSTHIVQLLCTFPKPPKANVTKNCVFSLRMNSKAKRAEVGSKPTAIGFQST